MDGLKTPPEKGFEVSFIWVLPTEVNILQRAKSQQPHFPEVASFSHLREAEEGFPPHLLNLKCLQPKIRFMPKWYI